MSKWDEKDMVVLQFHGKCGFAARIRPFHGSAYFGIEDIISAINPEEIRRGTILRVGYVDRDPGRDIDHAREIEVYYPGHPYEQSEHYQRRFVIQTGETP